jgi:hypothetical protein
MDIAVVIALIMIAIGAFRLYLVRSGKLPLAFGVQRFFPWIFMGTGVVFLIIALTD